MTYARFGIGVLVLAVALVVGGGSLGDDKKEVPAKGQLPANWKKLGLTEEQVKKVYTTQTEYRGKIAELEQKIQDLKKQERTDLEKVLTDAQKARLKEILLEKAPGEKPSEKPTEKK